MTRAKTIGYAIPWVLFVVVLGFTQWKINEVFRTRAIMVNKNDARLQKLEDHVDMLDMAILTGECP